MNMNKEKTALKKPNGTANNTNDVRGKSLDINIEDVYGDDPENNENKHLRDGIQNMQRNYFQHYSNLEKVKDTELNDIELNTLKHLYIELPKNQECLLYYLLKRTDNAFDGKNYTENMMSIFSECYRLPENALMIERKNSKVTDIEKDGDKEKLHISTYPFDELFIWSLMLYSGKEKEINLMKHYWAKTKHPIACCLAAMVLYNRFQTKHYVPDELKTKLKNLNQEFEKMAMGVLHECFENEKEIYHGNEQMVTKDLLLLGMDIFFNRTCLEIALEAEALDFLATTPVQDLLTDIWYERINPDISNWKILACILFPPLTFFPIRLFKKVYVRRPKTDQSSDNRPKSKNTVHPLEPAPDNSATPLRAKSAKRAQILNSDETKAEVKKVFTKIPNTRLKFRSENIDKKIILRLFAFMDAPLVKYIFHFIFYLLFLIIYLGFILFDYYPVTGMYPSDMTEYNVDSKFNVLKITITEVVLYVWVITFQMDYLRQFYQTENPNRRPLYKIRRFFTEDFWNAYDILPFLTFYAAVILRFIPKTSGGCLSSTESCYEAGRVIYCLSLILWFSRSLKFLVVLSFWGPKLIIIARMLKQLFIFVILLLLFTVPFGASFQSILAKTSTPSVSVVTTGFNRVYWPIFGEIGGILSTIDTFQCPNGTSSCTYGLYSFFLYIGLALYIVICNLLLLNMIIAIFGSTVEETQSQSEKLYKFQRYSFVKEYYKKTIIPPPFIFIEFFILAIVSIVTCCKRNMFWQYSFKINNVDQVAEDEYINYQKSYLQYYIELSETEEAKNSNGNSEATIAYLTKMKSESDKRIQSLEKNIRDLLDQRDQQTNEKLRSIKSSIDELLSNIKNK